MPDPGKRFPLAPLLAAYLAAPRLQTRRDAAVRAANQTWFTADALDTLSDDDLAGSLREFYLTVCDLPWRPELVTRQTRLLRHGLTHLFRGQDPLPVRLARCVDPHGAYAVPGLGASFWAAVAKAIDPDRLPDWHPRLYVGLARCGLTPATPPRAFADRWAVVVRGYEQVLAAHPELTASDLDRFFVAVSQMVGRELPAREPPSAAEAITRGLRELRTLGPLKKRATAYAALTDAVNRAISDRVPEAVVAAVRALVRPESTTDLQPEEVGPLLDRLAGVRSAADLGALSADLPWAVRQGFWLTAGVLHARAPARFPLWTGGVTFGLAALDDAADPALSPVEQYTLLCDVASALRQRFRVHPCEVAPLLAAIGEAVPQPPQDDRFAGFCTDTFRFLNELGEHNDSRWMAGQRERYRFAVRDPLVELCAALADRYVRPVLGGEYGWELETDPRPGRAVSSVNKNDFGRSGPYTPVLWVAFYRKRLGHMRDDVQLYVRVAAGGVGYGFRLGRRARDAGRRLRATVQEHAELLFAALQATGAVGACEFRAAADGEPVRLKSAADLREWAAGKELVAERRLPPDAPLLRTDELVGEVLLTFDRLVPLCAAAVEDAPRPVLARRAGAPDGRPAFDRAAFRDTTLLSDLWLDRTLDLLRLKKQLVLQGVPGTGKTHVARCLARLLTGDRADCVRLVQFHPGYSYEEFVEGIRPKSVEADGRSHVTYPVEPGLLAGFADRAAKHPADPHVLIIDEINRGNLPRVFGELLYLLEYRDQEVTLPYSKAPFRLPNNLYLVATMNPADRSAAGLDQAVRRRFSFVDMPPDAAVLGRWLAAHPPADPDPEFAARLVRWFDELNRRLARDLGPDRQVGHSYFLVPGLTRDGLRAVWDHHVRPALADAYPGRPERVAALDPNRLFDDKPRRAAAGRGAIV
ncbi:MAG: DUF2461 family protein [Gemmataceae bacterium]